MPERWSIAAAWLGVAIFLLAGVASAERVLLVRPPRSDAALAEAFNRLRAELGLSEFEVVTLDEGAALRSSGSLAQAARGAGAFAGIVLVRRDDVAMAEVWIRDRATGRAAAHLLEPGPSKEAANLLAVRAVDLLRASVRDSDAGELPANTPPARANVDTRPVPLSRAERDIPAPDWELRAEGLQMGAWSTIGAAYGPSIGLSRKIAERLRVGLVLAGPLLGASWRASRGSATIRQAIGLAELSFSAWRSRSLGLRATIGAGVYHLDARGQPDPSLVAESDRVDSGLVSVGLCGEYRFASAASIVVGGRAFALSPRPGVAIFQEQTVLAMPLAAISAGLAVGF